MAKARAHSAEPLGKAMAMMDAILMIRTIPLGSIPATMDRDAAMGVRTAAVPVLDIKVVITMAVTANTKSTNTPEGLSPETLSKMLANPEVMALLTALAKQMG